VVVGGGSVAVDARARIAGSYRQPTGTLAATVPARCRSALLTVDRDATLGGVLAISGDAGHDLTVLRARRVQGRFARVVAPAGHRATVTYTRTAVTVRLHRA
jgi:hypothetical protein